MRRALTWQMKDVVLCFPFPVRLVRHLQLSHVPRLSLALLEEPPNRIVNNHNKRSIDWPYNRPLVWLPVRQIRTPYLSPT